MPDDMKSPSFLSTVDIEYGPRDILGRFFLLADEAARDRGIRLSFGTFQQLVHANQANSDSWQPVISTYRPELAGIGPEDFCIFGRDAGDRIVATHAVRIFNIPDSSFKEHAETMKLFYADPQAMRREGESCVVTAPMAAAISGKVYFGGAAWYHPSFRGRGLGSLVPRVSRALALARSSIDWVAGVMTEKVVQSGLAERSGYKNLQWEMKLHSADFGTARCAVTWMSRQELVQDIADFTATLRSQVDHRIAERGNEQSAALAGPTSKR